MKVVFRADASLQIGTGHVMRCLTLADALTAQGAICEFICREHPGNLIAYIQSKGHAVHSLGICSNVDADLNYNQWLGSTQAQDVEACAPLLANLQPDWLVVDHYALDARWETGLARYYRKLMVIDDLADRPHVCNILLDQTYGRDACDYSALVPNNCSVLCGANYALLRPEFAALRAYSLQRRLRPELKRLLITMGGVDGNNATSQVLKCLYNSPLPEDCEITVVMGATAPWLTDIRQQAQTMPWPTKVYAGVNNMAELMAESDWAIGAAGSTSWEFCCLGLPNILICTADNQRTVIATLSSTNATVKLDLDELNQADGIPFHTQYSQLSRNLRAYSTAAARVVDGLGASRLCAELLRCR